MKINKIVLAFAVSAAIMSGCTSTDEKQGSLIDGELNADNNALTRGVSDGSSVSGEQFGANGLNDGGHGLSRLGPEFTDPANPLSKLTVYFMYDSSQIQQDFIPVLAAHAQYLMSHPGQRVILEGHADERGSREYNIALGEQRAKSVYRMMKVQGVSGNQLEIVSYGEEKPATDGMGEAAWQLNRRVEIAYQVQ